MTETPNAGEIPASAETPVEAPTTTGEVAAAPETTPGASDATLSELADAITETNAPTAEDNRPTDGAVLRYGKVTAVGTGDNLGKAQTDTTGEYWNPCDVSYLPTVGDLVYLFQQGPVSHIGGQLGGKPSAPAVGTIWAYAGATPPLGWLQANGQAVSRTTYAELFAICGVTYGAGDGNTTFNIPNATNRALIGYGNLIVRGEMGGSEFQTLTVTQLPNHSHNIAPDSHNHTVNPGSHTHQVNPGGHSHQASQGSHDHAGQSHTHPMGHDHAGGTHSHGMGHDHPASSHSHSTPNAGGTAGRALGVTETAGPAGGQTSGATVNIAAFNGSTGGASTAVANFSGNTGAGQANVNASDAGAISISNTDLPSYNTTAADLPMYTTSNHGAAQFTSGPAGQGAQFNNMPPYLGVNYIIRAER